MENQFMEKREAKRIRRPFTASVRVYHEEEKAKESSKWNIVIIKDVSRKGISFKYNKKLKSGTVLELKIALPFAEEPFYCLGRVCRVDKKFIQIEGIKRIDIYSTAVLFTEIETGKQEDLDRLVREFASREKAKNE